MHDPAMARAMMRTLRYHIEARYGPADGRCDIVQRNLNPHDNTVIHAAFSRSLIHEFPPTITAERVPASSQAPSVYSRIWTSLRHDHNGGVQI
jgi:hypothetical protein